MSKLAELLENRKTERQLAEQRSLALLTNQEQLEGLIGRKSSKEERYRVGQSMLAFLRMADAMEREGRTLLDRWEVLKRIRRSVPRMTSGYYKAFENLRQQRLIIVDEVMPDTFMLRRTNMATTELSRAIRSSRGFFREVLHLAEEQGYTITLKNQGIQFVKVGCGVTFCHDPYNDSHAQRVVRKKLESIGLRFPSEHTRGEPMHTNGQIPAGQTALAQVQAANPPAATKPEPAVPPIALPPSDSKFGKARAKISEAITVLSDLERIIGEIEVDSERVTKLRELLKQL